MRPSHRRPGAFAAEAARCAVPSPTGLPTTSPPRPHRTRGGRHPRPCRRATKPAGKQPRGHALLRHGGTAVRPARGIRDTMPSPGASAAAVVGWRGGRKGLALHSQRPGPRCVPRMPRLRTRASPAVGRRSVRPRLRRRCGGDPARAWPCTAVVAPEPMRPSHRRAAGLRGRGRSLCSARPLRAPRRPATTASRNACGVHSARAAAQQSRWANNRVGTLSAAWLCVRCQVIRDTTPLPGASAAAAVGWWGPRKGLAPYSERPRPRMRAARASPAVGRRSVRPRLRR